MACQYTLEWLDSLINDSLNSTKPKSETDEITSGKVQEVLRRIEKEKVKHQHFLNNEVFRLLEKEKIKVLINQYYGTLVLLLHQAWYNQTDVLRSNPWLQPIYVALIQNLKELIFFLETRFASYIDSDHNAPITHLLALKEQLTNFLITDVPNLETKLNNTSNTAIIRNNLQLFIADIDKRLPITRVQIKYLNELTASLKELSEESYTTCNPEKLTDLLIYFNFNSLIYLDYLTSHLKDKVNGCPDSSSRLELLNLLRKEFNQKQIKSGIALFPQEKDIKILLNHWFSHEIYYLESKYRLAKLSSQTASDTPLKKPEESSTKVACDLSVDQMSLLLRAAADLQVIKARSLNSVFKQIVPHLSTATKPDISWDSMRSKSYAAEKKDKDIAIQTLENMIKKVKEY